MNRIISIMVKGVAGVGMLDGLSAIFTPAERHFDLPAHGSATVEEAFARDAAALRGDLIAVGVDMRKAMDEIGREIGHG